jgi:3-deoxy-D-manno-octulosonate 8-phosphate phosphatase (KDO 8-P phosphatase)
MVNFKECLQTIKAFAFDVDGVFTDGSVILLPSGDQVRTMNIKDGYAVQYAAKKGYPIAIISGGHSEAVRLRFEYLGVKDIFLNSKSKKEIFHEFLNKYNLQPEDILYMGDDLPDLEILQLAGIPTCPADAAEEVKAVSAYISGKDGGKGCVRDVIEQVLKVQGRWLDLDAFIW